VLAIARGRRLLALGLSFLAVASAWTFQPPPAAAQDDEAEAQPLDDATLQLFDLQRRLDEGDLADAPLGEYNEAVWAFTAFQSLRRGQYTRARELSAQILQKDPTSIPGNCLMGLVYHRSEGNLPKALFFLKKTRQLVEDGYGPVPTDEDVALWHSLVLVEQAMVSGEMGRHEDKLRYLEEHDALYRPALTADRGWPLMRLRRYDEARKAVEEALKLEEEPFQVASAMTALCAIEAEQHRRQQSYEACLAAAQYERDQADSGPTPFTNAAEASLGMLKMDEAEKLILEASQHFTSDSVSNPWLDLMHLYLGQGRTAEALDSVRRMVRWRNRQPPYMDEQNRSETELAGAIFLLVAGRAEEATRITGRALERPDRTGFTSSQPEQLIAAAAVVDSLAWRLAAERKAEQASWSSWKEALPLYPQVLAARWQSWLSARRATAQATHEDLLVTTLQPYMAGSIELPEWIKPEFYGALGPGVVEAALVKARKAEQLPGAEGYFLATEAELARLDGDAKRALERVEAALEQLPGAEKLLRARTAAVGAWAAFEQGRNTRAIELLDQVMQADPGTIRRLGVRLPVSISTTRTALAERAGHLLAGSPRFQTGGNGGFRLTVDGDRGEGNACLLGPGGNRFGCARVTARAGEDLESLAARLAEELHVAAFAPRLDLTQADLRSLDGSPTAAGGRASERLLSILPELAPDRPSGGH
jgi:tetratricopeptide (TPR) repeat protein